MPEENLGIVQYKGLNLHGCSFCWSFRHQTLTESVSQELEWVLEDGYGQRDPATALPGGAHGCPEADMTHRVVGQQVQWSGEQEKGTDLQMRLKKCILGPDFEGLQRT